MATLLRQITAVDIAFGPFLDETDGKTAETGLTITQADIRLKKNGGNWAQKNAAQTLSHEENGWYEVSLDTTDTDTLGILIVAVHESGALPVWREFLVVSWEVYDSFISNSGTGLRADVRGWLGTTPATPTVNGVPEVDVTHWNGTAIPGVDTAGYPKVTIKDGTGTGELDTSSGKVAITDGAIAAATFAAGAITSTVLADDAITANKIAASAIGSSELADGAITSAKFGAAAINAAAVAADAIDADALATDAVNEIVAAVWLAANRTLTALDEDVTTIDLDATIQAALGLATANLDAQLDALPTAAENAAAVWTEPVRTITELDEDSMTIDIDATMQAALGLASANLDVQLAALAAADTAILAAIAALEDTSVSDIFTTVMTESYAANGVAPTLAQALYAIHQAIMHFSISGTNKTVKQLNNSTTAFVIAHNDSLNPTAASRT